jgi:RNA polymerase sigma-B factor
MIDNNEFHVVAFVPEEASNTLETTDENGLGFQAEALSDVSGGQSLDNVHSKNNLDDANMLPDDPIKNMAETMRPAIRNLLKGNTDSELFARLRAGDQTARDRLAEKHLSLAYGLALRYRMSSEPLDDLKQVASLGLLKAIDRFDESRGITFSSYAVPTITGEIKRYFRDKSWSIYVTRASKERAAEVKNAISRLEQTQVTIAQIADELKISKEDAAEALGTLQNRHLKSLDAPASEDPSDGGNSVGATLRDPQAEAEYDLNIASLDLERLMDRALLTESQQTMLTLRLDGYKQAEIAQRIGCSQMHVSRTLRIIFTRIAPMLRVGGVKKAA